MFRTDLSFRERVGETIGEGGKQRADPSASKRNLRADRVQDQEGFSLGKLSVIRSCSAAVQEDKPNLRHRVRLCCLDTDCLN